KADGTGLVYAGYIGGSLDDEGNGIAVDAAGSAYIVGTTQSSQATFPVSGTWLDLTQNGGWDAFVAKVNSTGTGLDFCGYVGGGESDYGTSIALGSGSNFYITGYTGSTQANGFPISGGPDTTFNGGDLDAFVAKIRELTGTQYCGYIGGSMNEWGHGIAVDAWGRAHVAGSTLSNDHTFPNGGGMLAYVGPDAFNNGKLDAFAVRVKSDGSGLEQATYFGGTSDDEGYGIAVDDTANVYVTGKAGSPLFVFGGVPGPDTSHNGGAEAFVAKIIPDWSALEYGGYIGGHSADVGRGIAVDSTGAADIVGITGSDQDSFPDGNGFGSVPGFDQTFNGTMDAFVVKVKPTGTGLVYATYFGGQSRDDGIGIAVDRAGNAFITGFTRSTPGTFPRTVGPDLNWNGSYDAFVAKLGPPRATLTIQKSGPGNGTITSHPAGINCGATCVEDFYLRTYVTLSVTPDAPYSSFIGWIGDCDLNGNVSMNSNKSCTAFFAENDHWGDTWSGSGAGLTVFSSDGTGLQGRSDGSSGRGVYGYASAASGTTFGVRGQSASTSGRAVYGNASATNGTTYGFYGLSASTKGRAIYGYATATSGTTYGLYAQNRSISGRAVYGYASAASGTTFGVFGSSRSTSGRAIYGYASALSGTTYGVFGRVNSPSGWAGKFYTTKGNGVTISTPAGKTGLNVIGGSKSAVVSTSDGSRLLYAEESTEVWFSDYGSARLKEGSATIAINPIFAETVNLHETYHVFLQPYGGADLYVADRTPEKFLVLLWEGDPNVEFSYRIVAKRLGHESQRLERAPWADDDPNLYPEKLAEWEAKDRELHALPEDDPTDEELLLEPIPDEIEPEMEPGQGQVQAEPEMGIGPEPVEVEPATTESGASGEAPVAEPSAPESPADEEEAEIVYGFFIHIPLVTH
ncbi:MAG TPA: SBBP repeat-containing protein, partial [Anaerolineae bacterium]|nr:SBBP repeat-containing protein [Anaerolineae bacterium]